MQKPVARFFALGLIAMFAVGSGLVVTAQTQIQLTIAGVSGNDLKWLSQSVVPAFEAKMKAKGKSVNVSLQEFTGKSDQLKQQYALDLQVGKGADVMSFDGFWVPEFVASNLLKPLDQVAGPEVNRWEGWKQIPAGLRELMGYKGKVYGVGNGTDVRMIFYRKDLFQKAGIRVPWQPKSWDDLLDAARKLKKALPDVTPLQLNAGTAMGEATTLQGWYMLLLGTGIKPFDDEQDKWVVRHQGILDALNFYKTVYVDEKLGDARLQLIQEGRDRSFESFRDAKMAMLIEGDYFWRSILLPKGGDFPLEKRDELVGWAKMPAQAPGKGVNAQSFVSASGGTGFVLNPNTKVPKEAWELMSFMASKAMQTEFQKILPRIRARKDVPITQDPIMSKMAKTLLPLTVIRPKLATYPKVSSEIQLMTERVVSGQASPLEAMNAYAEAVKKIVGAENVLEQPVK
jgi:multiple sugar transport system substrate-binding protein